MSAILAFLTAAVLIVVGLLRKKPQPSNEQVIIKRYVHPGHGWMRPTDDGDVLVGIDDFAQSVIGSIDEIQLPRLLHSVHQGDIGWKLRHGERLIPMVSPVTGFVIEKNEMVLRNPSLINTAPYGDGWLVRVRPRKLATEEHNLMTGKTVHEWHDAVRSRLAGLFSGIPALMYQDGGVLVKNLCDRCSDEEWTRVCKEFFLVDTTTPTT